MDAIVIHQGVFWTIFIFTLLTLPAFYFSIGRLGKKNINVIILIYGFSLLLIGLTFTLIINDSEQTSAWLTASKELLKTTFTLVGSAFIAFAFIEKVKDIKEKKND